MTKEPGYYKQLLESLLEAKATPDWVRYITPTDRGPVAAFYKLDYQLQLANLTKLKVNRVEFDVVSGIIRVYFSLDSNSAVAANPKLEGLDQALLPLFEQLFAPYDLGDVRRYTVGDFIQHDAHEVYAIYGSYYLSGQVETAWFDYLSTMDYDTKLQAVKSNPDYIKHIEDPDEQLQMAAVKRDPYSIQWIENPTDAAQIAAITEVPATVVNILNPTVLSKTDVKTHIVKYLLERMKINAVHHVTGMIRYLRNHNAEWPELGIIEKSLNANKLG